MRCWIAKECVVDRHSWIAKGSVADMLSRTARAFAVEPMHLIALGIAAETITSTTAANAFSSLNRPTTIPIPAKTTRSITVFPMAINYVGSLRLVNSKSWC